MGFNMQAGTHENWDQVVSTLPGRHFLQTWEWGEAKRASGWQPTHRVWVSDDDQVSAAALILTRAVVLKGIKLPLRMMYIPRGPLLLDWQDQVLRRQILSDLRQIGRQQQVIFIKIDPQIELGRGVPGGERATQAPGSESVTNHLRQEGWMPAKEQVQFRNTMLIDLRPDADQLLASMKQKTRYNVRLAARRGVAVRLGDTADLELLFQMYAETAVRDRFTIRNADYYLKIWKDFITSGLGEPLLAEVKGEPVAGVIIFRFGGRAWYVYGMSREVHREKMPNYLLQWEAIRRAKQAGCTEYDLWGAPEKFDDEDDLWGVYRFKDGLGAEVVRFIGAYDLPINSLMYRAYSQVLPKVLALMRRRGESQTRGYIQPG